MTIDTWTIIRKEWKEFIVQRGSLRGNTLSLIIIIGILGILPPLKAGSGWIVSPGVLILAVWGPFLLVSSVVPDSFAGERERHTLETLLATRLSDRAILFGKIFAAIGYGWGLTLIILLIGLVTVNLSSDSNSLLLYPVTISIAILMLSLLGAWLAAGVGVLISLRVPTVRHAHQVLTAVGMLLLLIPIIIALTLPKDLLGQITKFNANKVAIIVIAVLIGLNIVLSIAATIRFKRPQLMLD
jgi:ABC-2 type transport system permease protein